MGLSITEKFKLLQDCSSWSGGYFPDEAGDYVDQLDDTDSEEFCREISEDNIKALLPVYQNNPKKFKKEFHYMPELLEELANGGKLSFEKLLAKNKKTILKKMIGMAKVLNKINSIDLNNKKEFSKIAKAAEELDESMSDINFQILMEKK